jgi:large subunit ribosomal protein L6
VSRLAKKPLTIPKGVQVTVEGNLIKVKGVKGQLEYHSNELIKLELTDEGVVITAPSTKSVKAEDKNFARAITGTTAANIRNLFKGVTEGFEKRLVFVGVGYRANLQGKALNLSLGFSHPVSYDIPDSIVVEVPTQTEVIIKGIDKCLVGQVAADIRAIRSVEPYKGKGVRYLGERVVLKETKKK